MGDDNAVASNITNDFGTVGFVERDLKRYFVAAVWIVAAAVVGQPKMAAIGLSSTTQNV